MPKTVVKKWFRDKEYGFLENGTGADIVVRKEDLVKCQYLKVGVEVEFECHLNKQGLIAKKVSLIRQNNNRNQANGPRNTGNYRIGVMT